MTAAWRHSQYYLSGYEIIQSSKYCVNRSIFYVSEKDNRYLYNECEMRHFIARERHPKLANSSQRCFLVPRCSRGRENIWGKILPTEGCHQGLSRKRHSSLKFHQLFYVPANENEGFLHLTYQNRCHSTQSRPTNAHKSKSGQKTPKNPSLSFLKHKIIKTNQTQQTMLSLADICTLNVVHGVAQHLPDLWTNDGVARTSYHFHQSWRSQTLSVSFLF